MFIDSRNQTAACDDVGDEDLSDTEVAAARNTVCNYIARQVPEAERLETANELMTILGIHPSQKRAEPGRTSLPRTSVSSASIRGAHLS